jgi:hypothetical protein
MRCPANALLHNIIAFAPQALSLADGNKYRVHHLLAFAQITFNSCRLRTMRQLSFRGGGNTGSTRPGLA